MIFGQNEPKCFIVLKIVIKLLKISVLIRVLKWTRCTRASKVRQTGCKMSQLDFSSGIGRDSRSWLLEAVFGEFLEDLFIQKPRPSDYSNLIDKFSNEKSAV